MWQPFALVAEAAVQRVLHGAEHDRHFDARARADKIMGVVPMEEVGGCAKLRTLREQVPFGLREVGEAFQRTTGVEVPMNAELTAQLSNMEM
jgi:hypothetical protein